MNSVNYEMIADNEGRLSETINEQCLLDAIKLQTGLDARAIVDTDPMTQLGFYTVNVHCVVKVVRKIEVKLWIVPEPSQK